MNVILAPAEAIGNSPVRVRSTDRVRLSPDQLGGESALARGAGFPPDAACAPEGGLASAGADPGRAIGLRLVPTSIKSTLLVRVDDCGRAFVVAHSPSVPVAEPPTHYGRRSTEYLTPRAARAVRGAALKADQLGMPLKVFWTLTMRPEARSRVESGGLVLGQEVGRFLNIVRSRLRRSGQSDSVVFIWIAENPKEANPHVHLLTNLVVPHSSFAIFAASLESAWGHGTVHLEFIREARAAGHYIIKAIGYSAKAAYDHTPQGKIAGRRYGISRAIQPQERTIEIEVPQQVYESVRRACSHAQDVEHVYELESGLVTPFGIAFHRDNGQERAAALLARMESHPPLPAELHEAAASQGRAGRASFARSARPIGLGLDAHGGGVEKLGARGVASSQAVQVE